MRRHMVARQIRARGIADERVLAAMEEVPREKFLPIEQRAAAFDDAPVSILEGQTLSQPYVVAYMLEALRPQATDRALEIGTGSGYAAAVLSRLVGEVFTVEWYASLAALAEDRFERLAYDNIRVLQGDGSRGWREHQPYQCILVSAGAPAVPSSLREQLARGGRMVIPVGPERSSQQLLGIERRADGSFEELDLGEVRFVPLVGAEGWEQPRSGADRLPPRARQRGWWQ